MMTLEQIKQALQDRRLTIVAKRTGLSYDTIRRIKSGEGDYHISTLKKISDYLEGNQNV